MLPLLLQVQLQQQLGAAPAQIPGGLGGQAAQIHRIEVAAGGQQVGPAAGGGAGRTGSDAAALQPRQKGQALLGAAGQQPRLQHRLQVLQHRCRVRADRHGWRAGVCRQGPLAELQGLLLQALRAITHAAGGVQQALIHRAEGLPLRIRPGVKIQPKVPGQGLGETGQPRLGRPGQAEQQFRQVRRPRQLAVAVQPQPDLGLLQFAQVAIGRIEAGVQVGLSAQGQLQIGQPLFQLPAQQGRPLAAAHLAGFPVLIQQGLQLLQLTVQAGPAQGWGEVVEDHGLAAALGLGPLARIIHDEWIEVGQGAQGPLREALG